MSEYAYRNTQVQPDVTLVPLKDAQDALNVYDGVVEVDDGLAAEYRQARAAFLDVHTRLVESVEFP